MTLHGGKLPEALLADLLAAIPSSDDRVLLGPAVGRDAAVINAGNGRVLVATTDPVTFATDEIGRYAVNVNANDVACMGARPLWFLASVLLPPGSDESLPAQILKQITDGCSELGVTLIGGHTEVTPTVTNPVVVGTMLGEASRDRVVAGRRASVGDALLLAGGIAVEGTALLAREHAPLLGRLGVPDEVISRAASMLLNPGISVVREARRLCEIATPSFMHDPTEGGLATALRELSRAADVGLEVDLQAIEIHPETREICSALALDPLGLLASGALLAIVRATDAEELASRRNGEDSGFRRIGTVVDAPPGVILAGEDSEISMPAFERDEIARFIESVVATESTE
jgi:hydrogenase expression/formation protein HypE